MSHILTLVSSNVVDRPVTMRHAQDVQDILLYTEYHQLTCRPSLIEEGRALEIGLAQTVTAEEMSNIREAMADDKIDVFCLPIDGRRKKLLIADMDSTIIAGESLDDLAEHMNLKNQISEITSRAMNGELNFQDALRERVMLLKGLEVSAMTQTAKKMELNPGAQELVTTMRANGSTCILVTGGFTFFADIIATKIGFHKFHGNILDINEQVLTGGVKEPILDKSAKLRYLYEYVQELKIIPDKVMAIGDGANDLPMLEAAGFGVGYHPKDILKDKLLNHVIYGDLTAPLFAQGYTQARIDEAMEIMGQ